MTACKSCGADAPGIACEFCGAVQRQPQSLEEEMTALDGISRAAQAVADKAAANVFSADTARAKRNFALTAFWATAYMPSSPDALVQVATIASGGIQANHLNMPSQNQLSGALATRAHAAATALIVRGDPRGSVLRAEIERLEKRAAEQSKGPQQHIIILVVTLIAFVILIAAVLMTR